MSVILYNKNIFLTIFFFFYHNEIKCQILNGSAGRFPSCCVHRWCWTSTECRGERIPLPYQSQISHIWPASGSLAGNSSLFQTKENCPYFHPSWNYFLEQGRGKDSKPSSYRTKETPHSEGTVIAWMTNSFVSYTSQGDCFYVLSYWINIINYYMFL